MCIRDRVLCEAHPRDELVDVMVFFEGRPVAEMAGMSVSLGQPLGQAEQMCIRDR